MPSLNKVTLMGHLGKDPEMKRCSKCKNLISKDNFAKGKNLDGLMSACKNCSRQANKIYYYQRGGKQKKDIYYIENRDKLLPKLRVKGGISKYKPDKQPARMAVFRAIKSGEIIKPDKCGNCGGTGRLEAHHYNGYDHSLDVNWLCPSCHHLEHYPEFKIRMEIKEKLYAFA